MRPEEHTYALGSSSGSYVRKNSPHPHRFTVILDFIGDFAPSELLSYIGICWCTYVFLFISIYIC
jgi:hypothetical protein